MTALLRALHQIGGQIADAQNANLLHFDLHGISSSTSAIARAVAAMSFRRTPMVAGSGEADETPSTSTFMPRSNKD
jgi:hypothetical protein